MTNPHRDPESLILNLRDCLARYYSNPINATVEDARDAVRQMASYLLTLKRHENSHPILHSVFESAMLLWNSGLQLAPPAKEDVERAQGCLKDSWPGLLAASFLSAPWRLREIPTLDGVPPWLWGHFCRWILMRPTGAIGDDITAAHVPLITNLVQDVARWTDKNIGSHAVRLAIADVIRTHPGALLLPSASDLRPVLAALGRIISRGGAAATVEGFLPTDDTCRVRVRIGFLFASLASTPETRAAKAFYQHLDPEAFEVILIASKIGTSEFERECSQLGSSTITLEKDLPSAIRVIREADLDVAVIVPDLALHSGEWVELGSHRLARVTLTLPHVPTTTGLPAIQFRVLGAEAGADVEPSSERVARMACAGYVCDPGPVATLDAEALRLLRVSLNLPENVPVLATAAELRRFSPETLSAWSGVLRGVPNAHFIWALPPQTNRRHAKFVSQAFCYQIGLDPSRLILSFDEKRSALALAEVYLEPIGTSSVDDLSLALTYSLVPVAAGGQTLRARGSESFLGACGLAECVAPDTESYVNRAISLCSDIAFRAAAREKASLALATYPILTDTLARSDAFAALLKEVMRRYRDEGDALFAADLPPIEVPDLPASPDSLLQQALEASDREDVDQARKLAETVLGRHPALSIARHVLGRIFFQAGQPQRAIPYLLGALQGQEQSADLWLEIATALRATGANTQAIGALEGCLRIDASRIDAWELLAELASEVGHTELLAETREVLQSLRSPVSAAN